MTKKTLFLALTISVIFFSACREANTRLMIGGFTKPGEKGLSVFDFNRKTGAMKLISQSDVGMNPSYFCFSRKKNILYVANEVQEFNGLPGGGLTTLKVNPEDGSMKKLNEMVIPYGGGCFISMSPDSGHVFIANYPKGSVVVVKLDEEGVPEGITDTILYVTDTAKVSHAHMIQSDPSGKKIFVSDLGLDRVMIYDFDKVAGKLHPTDTVCLTEGSGPRHFAFSKEGSKLYLINELGSKMMVFDINQDNRPKLIQTLSTYTEDFEGKNYCADVHLSADEKYLYGSNRGENTIVTFRIEPGGTLSVAGHTSCGGNWPRNFTLDPEGNFLLAGNQKSDSIAVFKLDKTTGLPLEPAAKKYKVAGPACLKFY